ncbi:MAG: hypothetical protein OEM21_10190 [Nitrosopumilus sp.]|nr:hypothetical protein [Nitrosopumilus sp.]
MFPSTSQLFLPEANAQFDVDDIDLKILGIKMDQPNLISVELYFQNNGESSFKPDSHTMALIFTKSSSSAEDLYPDSKNLIIDHYYYSHPERLGTTYSDSQTGRDCGAIDFSVYSKNSKNVTICFEITHQGNLDINQLINNDQIFFKFGKSCPSCKIISLKDISQPTTNFLIYDNPTYDLKMQYPSGWEILENPDEFTLVMFSSPLEGLSDTLQENFGVSSPVISTGETLNNSVDVITEELIGLYESFGLNVTIVESKTITISGNNAKKITLTMKNPDISLHQTMFVTIKGNFVYSFLSLAESSKFSEHDLAVQEIIDSVEIGSSTISEQPSMPPIIPQMISGKYVNSQVGMEIEFPNELSGFEFAFPKDIDYSELPAELQGMAEMYSGMTMVMMLPAELDPTENIEMMMLTIMETSSIETFSEFISQTVESGASQSSGGADVGIESQPECEISNQTILEINEMKSVKIDSECYEPTENMTVTMSIYMFLTPQYVISPMYIIVQETDKQNDMSIFENSLNTLNIENTIDISDPNSYAELFGLKITKENIVIESKSHEIDIVSDSTTSNFSFDETNYTMSFESEGDSTLASTEIYLGNALMEPFTVTIDGNVEDTFMVTKDNTTGQTSIGVSYFHPVEKISIKGNKANVLSDTPIPDWIRNNASWWVEGNIDDKAFVGGIQFLIKEGIIQIPETTKSSTTSDSQEIPSWIKNNADWWSQGLISDADFLKGIQFMVENGIIAV